MADGPARLDEYDKTEWMDVARRLLPGLTESEYDSMWERFQEAKYAHLVLKGMQ